MLLSMLDVSLSEDWDVNIDVNDMRWYYQGRGVSTLLSDDSPKIFIGS